MKIYEAMACGKAVVSTTIGAEGLSTYHGHDILLADDPQAFAQAVVQVLSDQNLRRNLELNAASTAAKYDWPAIGQTFHNVLAAVVESQRSTALPSAIPALNGGNS